VRSVLCRASWHMCKPGNRRANTARMLSVGSGWATGWGHDAFGHIVAIVRELVWKAPTFSGSVAVDGAENSKRIVILPPPCSAGDAAAVRAELASGAVVDAASRSTGRGISDYHRSEGGGEPKTNTTYGLSVPGFYL
jgi:hypothetical protein